MMHSALFWSLSDVNLVTDERQSGAAYFSTGRMKITHVQSRSWDEPRDFYFLFFAL